MDRYISLLHPNAPPSSSEHRHITFLYVTTSLHLLSRRGTLSTGTSPTPATRQLPPLVSSPCAACLHLLPYTILDRKVLIFLLYYCDIIRNYICHWFIVLYRSWWRSSWFTYIITPVCNAWDLLDHQWHVISQLYWVRYDFVDDLSVSFTNVIYNVENSLTIHECSLDYFGGYERFFICN